MHHCDFLSKRQEKKEVNVAAKRKQQQGNSKFDPRPIYCHACGIRLEYGKMDDFGIRPFGSGYCYYCPGCGRYVATHKKKTKDALGIPGTDEERRLRRKCHEAFDATYDASRGRNRAYHTLAKALNLKEEDCHFGYMEKDMLEKSLEIIYSWEGSFG